VRSASTALTAIWVLLAAVAIAASVELGYSRSLTPGLIAQQEKQFGSGARARLEGWKSFVREAGAIDAAARRPGEDRLLPSVNGFFNRLPYITDQVHWRAEDYWATPAEFLASNGGDCEDYAIAKYFTLKELGVPIGRLRLVYARTSRTNVAHMVLAYYASPGAVPLILDSLEGSIRPASERPDLIPVYSFNDDDLTYPKQGQPAIAVSSSSFRLWRVVLDKLAREMTY
jgi:predicted transglutaminase-like cysteine proteinase